MYEERTSKIREVKIKMSGYKLSYAIVSNDKNDNYELVRVESNVPWETLRKNFSEQNIVMELFYFSSGKAMDHVEVYRRAVNELNCGRISVADLGEKLKLLPNESFFYISIKSPFSGRKLASL